MCAKVRIFPRPLMSRPFLHRDLFVVREPVREKMHTYYRHGVPLERILPKQIKESTHLLSILYFHANQFIRIN